MTGHTPTPLPPGPGYNETDPEMNKTPLLALTMAFLLLASLTASGTAQGTAQGVTSELDAFWAEVSRTVGEGDFEGYAATYHPDAVLVSALSNNSYPISQALAGWEEGFVDTREGRMGASVEFRFTQLLADDSTAHQTGIFNYAIVNAEGERTDQYIHFEALLVKRGGWKMVMEYQKSMATREEWDAAG
jgi:ketosteroid isomerase-like protein